MQEITYSKLDAFFIQVKIQFLLRIMIIKLILLKIRVRTVKFQIYE
jgi:hypothetical protein